MDVSSIKKDRGIKKQTNKQNGKQYLHLNYWLQSANKRSNWAYHNHLRSWPCWWAFLHAEKKKRKTRIWWESLFTFMYQQISLRRRRNITPVSNVWKAAPIRLFRLGPQRTQRNNGKVFRIFLQPDWQIDNGFFITPVMAHRWGNKTEIFVTKISALFRRRALPGLFED